MENNQRKSKSSKNTKFKAKYYRKHLTQAKTLQKTLYLILNPMKNNQHRRKSSKNTKFKLKSDRKHLTQA